MKKNKKKIAFSKLSYLRRFSISILKLIFVVVLIVLTMGLVGSAPSETLDLAEKLVPIAGIIIALAGLDTWQRQIRGTDKYRVASELLLQVFRVREAIRAVRSPLVEYLPDDESGKNEEEARFAGYVEALDRRWSSLQEPTAELSLAALKAEVHLGKDIKNIADELMGCVRELQIAFEMHIDMSRPNSIFIDDPFHIENRKTLFSKPDKDEYWKKVQQIVARIEKSTRRFL